MLLRSGLRRLDVRKSHEVHHCLVGIKHPLARNLVAPNPEDLAHLSGTGACLADISQELEEVRALLGFIRLYNFHRISEGRALLQILSGFGISQNIAEPPNFNRRKSSLTDPSAEIISELGIAFQFRTQLGALEKLIKVGPLPLALFGEL